MSKIILKNKSKHKFFIPDKIKLPIKRTHSQPTLTNNKAITLSQNNDIPNYQTNPKEFTEYVLRTKGHKLPQHNWKDNLAEKMVTSTGGRYLGMTVQGMANASLNPFKYAANELEMDLKPLTPLNTTERLIEAGAESATDGLILGGLGNVAVGSGLFGKTVQASEIIKKAGDIRSAEIALQYAPKVAKIANKYLNQNMLTQGLISASAGAASEGIFPTDEMNTFEDNAMRTGTEFFLKPTLKTLVKRSAIGIEPILKRLIR